MSEFRASIGVCQCLHGRFSRLVEWQLISHLIQSGIMYRFGWFVRWSPSRRHIKVNPMSGTPRFFFSFFLFFFKIKWMGKNDVRQSNAMAPARSQPATTGWEPWLEATAKTQILVSEYAKFHETESLCLQLRPMFTPIDYGDFLLPSPLQLKT